MKREILLSLVLYFFVALIPMITRGQSNETLTTSTVKIAVPVRKFNEFVDIQRNPYTGEYDYSGFAIEVFEEVMNTTLPSISYKFVRFAKPDGTMNGSFDDMLQAVYSKDYDGAVGEITILYSRTRWVDFTMPFLESPIAMLIPIKQQSTIKAIGFSLIGISYAFVITTYGLSFIVAAICVVGITKWSRFVGGNDNKPRDKTLGALIHTRLLMTTFLLIIVILVASYIVSQASPNTPKRGSGTVKNLTQLIRNGAKVGYREGSFIHDLLLVKGFDESNLIRLKSEEEMVDKLSKGTSNGGVDAIVANAPQLKLLQAKYCDNFTMVLTPNLHSTGIGFAFRKESKLGRDVSDGILKIADKGRLGKIQEKTIGSLEVCEDDSYNNHDVASTFLSPHHNWILIVGGSLVALLTILSFFVV